VSMVGGGAGGGGWWVGVWLGLPTLLDGRYGRTHGRGGRAEWPKQTNPVCTLMQFKKSRTHIHTDRETDTHRHTDTQTHRAYKWLQVPPSNLTVNVGNDKII